MADRTPTRIHWGALGAVGAATLVLTSDVTAMATALPTIERDLTTDLTSAQWVMNAYLIAFGISIVSGGWLADRLGRRRVLVAGLAAFSVFALLGALAPSVGWLIGARGLQGLAAGAIWPAVLGIAFASVPPSARVMAVGLMLGAAGLGEAFGPVLGGLVTDELSWRWILAVKPLIAAAAAVLCIRNLPDDARSGRVSLDLAGTALLSFALLALLYALDEAVALGWSSPRIVAALAIAVVLAVAFVVVELRSRRPLIPRDAIGDRALLGAGLLMATTAPMFFVALLYVPQVLAKVLGYSPSETGLGMLPMQLVFAVTAPLCGVAAARVGLKAPHVIGLVAMAASAIVFSRFGAGDGYAQLLPAMILYGLGVGLAYPAVTAMVMLALGAPRASLAAGILFMVELVCGGLATAIATTVVSSSSDFLSGLGTAFVGVAALAAAGALLALALTPGHTAPELGD